MGAASESRNQDHYWELLCALVIVVGVNVSPIEGVVFPFRVVDDFSVVVHMLASAVRPVNDSHEPEGEKGGESEFLFAEVQAVTLDFSILPGVLVNESEGVFGEVHVGDIDPEEAAEKAESAHKPPVDFILHVHRSPVVVVLFVGEQILRPLVERREDLAPAHGL